MKKFLDDLKVIGLTVGGFVGIVGIGFGLAVLSTDGSPILFAFFGYFIYMCYIISDISEGKYCEHTHFFGDEKDKEIRYRVRRENTRRNNIERRVYIMENRIIHLKRVTFDEVKECLESGKDPRDI